MRAVAEATENEKDASFRKDEESNEKESRKGERAGVRKSSDQDSGKGSIGEVEEQEELMTHPHVSLNDPPISKYSKADTPDVI